LAKGDRSKWQYYLDMPVVEFLNAVSFDNEQHRARRERLERAAQDAKNAKDGQVYMIALLQELLF
jgi:hypothetical protein